MKVAFCNLWSRKIQKSFVYKFQRFLSLHLQKVSAQSISTKSNADIICFKHFWQYNNYACILIRKKNTTFGQRKSSAVCCHLWHLSIKRWAWDVGPPGPVQEVRDRYTTWDFFLMHFSYGWFWNSSHTISHKGFCLYILYSSFLKGKMVIDLFE